MLIYPRVEVGIKDAARGNGFTTRAPAGLTVALQRGGPAEAEVQFPLMRSLDLVRLAVGNDVDISLGNDALGVASVFAGAVTELSPNLPLVVKAKDKGHKALANAFKATHEGKGWPDIVKDAAARAGLTAEVSTISCPMSAPKKFRVDGQTPAQVFNRACEATGWVWQILPGTTTLYFGPRDEAARVTTTKTWVFAFGVLAPLGAPLAPPNVIKSDLKYKGTGRYKKIIATLVDAGWENKGVAGEFATPDFKEGDAVLRVGPFETALTGDAAKDKKTAEERARSEFLKAGAGGFEGSFETFWNPFVVPGVTVKLVDNDHPERGGNAVVDKSTFRFSPGGGGRMTVDVAGIAEGI